MKEYVWHNYLHTTEEVVIQANSFEEAEKKFLDGQGDCFWLESYSTGTHECIKKADDFEDDEEEIDECR